MIRRAALGLAALAVAAPAAARAPAYPHKAGVSPETYNQEVAGCWNDGIKAMNDPAYVSPWTPNPVTEGTAAGAAGGALARGMADGLMGGKRLKTTYYDCLIAKGYTLRRPDEASYKAYRKLKKDARAQQMVAWSTAPEPLHPAASRDEFD